MCRVPPDEHCLYHAVVAAQNVEAFWVRRDDQGRRTAPDPERDLNDVRNATFFKQRMLEVVELAQSSKSLELLKSRGATGYPHSDDLRYAAVVIRSRVHEVHLDDPAHPVIRHGQGRLALRVNVPRLQMVLATCRTIWI